MITLEKLDVHHVLDVASRLQDAQQTTIHKLDAAYARTLLSNKGFAYAIVEDGATIGCGGIAEAWPGRAIGWSLLTPRIFRYSRTLHRFVRMMLAEASWTRIEIDVSATHEAGKRWAEHLGFEMEGVRRKYTPDGQDMILYARVK